MENKEPGQKPIEQTLNETGNALIGCGCLLGFITLVLAILFGMGH